MKRLLKRGSLALVTLLVLLLVYGVLVEPRLILDEERHTIAVPALSQEAAGTELALISDLQVGMWWANTGMVERAVEHVVEERPDAVLLGGDFVYSTDPGVAVQVDTVMELLDPLIRSEIPAYAVLGNHDHAAGAAQELTEALEAGGVEVLHNESATLTGTGGGDPDQALHIVGVGPEVPGQADVSEALDAVPQDAPRFVLMHNPTTFPSLPAGSAPLAVAGHTHCGQVALPGTPRWSYLGLTDEEALVAEGFAPTDYGATGNELFVTCGIGFSVVPIRVNAPPEVVFFELQPARSA